MNGADLLLIAVRSLFLPAFVLTRRARSASIESLWGSFVGLHVYLCDVTHKSPRRDVASREGILFARGCDLGLAFEAFCFLLSLLVSAVKCNKSNIVHAWATNSHILQIRNFRKFQQFRPFPGCLRESCTLRVSRGEIARRGRAMKLFVPSTRFSFESLWGFVNAEIACL